jgi:hypothetical protein
MEQMELTARPEQLVHKVLSELQAQLAHKVQLAHKDRSD